MADFLPVWTGTFSNGVGLAGLGVLGEFEPWFGNSHATDSDWMFEIELHQSGHLHLYALSPEMTVVPEPGTMVLACIGVIAVAGCQLRRRRHRKQP
jgi:hypothetical protein